MLVSRGRNPNASEVIGQLITNPGLRSRVLTTLGLLLLVRLGIYIPMPGIDREAFKQFIVDKIHALPSEKHLVTYHFQLAGSTVYLFRSE